MHRTAEAPAADKPNGCKEKAIAMGTKAATKAMDFAKKKMEEHTNKNKENETQVVVDVAAASPVTEDPKPADHNLNLMRLINRLYQLDDLPLPAGDATAPNTREVFCTKIAKYVPNPRRMGKAAFEGAADAGGLRQLAEAAIWLAKSEGKDSNEVKAINEDPPKVPLQNYLADFLASAVNADFQASAEKEVYLGPLFSARVKKRNAKRKTRKEKKGGKKKEEEGEEEGKEEEPEEEAEADAGEAKEEEDGILQTLGYEVGDFNNELEKMKEYGMDLKDEYLDMASGMADLKDDFEDFFNDAQVAMGLVKDAAGAAKDVAGAVGGALSAVSGFSKEKKPSRPPRPTKASSTKRLNCRWSRSRASSRMVLS
jgi:hypothetical protein